MRALLTGGSGFVGQSLRRRLVDNGIEVALLGRSLPPGVAGFSLGGVQDSAAIRRAVFEFCPDFVFHLAGTVGADTLEEFTEVNVGYCARLLDALDAAGLAGNTRLLVTGSAAEYGIVEPAAMPVREDFCPRPLSLYGSTKLAQTELALRWAAGVGGFVTVARPFTLVGPSMPEHLAVGSFVAQLLAIRRNEAPPVLDVGDLSTRRDFMDVGDAADLLWRLIRCDEAAGKVVNLCSGLPVAIREVLDYAVSLIDVQVEIRESIERLRRFDMPVNYGDNSRLQALLGPTAFVPWQKSIVAMMLNDTK
jgi:GDP-4-dehydro-6-deoxy-D-mannose reductase